MAKAPPSSDTSTATPVIIKKYANRRLYNTETSSYITLEHIAQMTREGRDFQVFDARTGEDITRSVLTQIVMEEENGGQTMLPVNFLRQIISMYGDSMQSMVPHYLEASMEAFAENQTKFRDAALKPFEQLARQNMALFEAATAMLTGAAAKASDSPAPPPPAPAAAEAADKKAELARLEAEMAALKARMAKLGGGAD
ncbi:MAG: polyhydroxyalkanoate synthesis repressor PhaR [Polymorphobacter sp.]|uniref:polyhydroxyalkanoate synthesis repressor PhaR n=1 Tax=Polymorphobacter sp. TaxID=1909290 RepID=UPI003A86366F